MALAIFSHDRLRSPEARERTRNLHITKRKRDADIDNALKPSFERPDSLAAAACGALLKGGAPNVSRVAVRVTCWQGAASIFTRDG